MTVYTHMELAESSDGLAIFYVLFPMNREHTPNKNTLALAHLAVTGARENGACGEECEKCGSIVCSRIFIGWKNCARRSGPSSSAIHFDLSWTVVINSEEMIDASEKARETEREGEELVASDEPTADGKLRKKQSGVR